ncbi:MAG TPA: hypothetical protein PKM27_11555 [Saprospiraceae bacterium]|nr:hypothetical protein [Saprospiraceae bacterium]HNT22030.1 hypothetical protein [Saprospiraceae bacterium]
MKRFLFLTLFNALCVLFAYAQGISNEDIPDKKEIYSLIDQYSSAREKRDTAMLRHLLTPDADQLVSSGQWRVGIGEAVKGMLLSSESNPGSRRLIVDKIRFLDSKHAIADARYEIQNPDGAARKMWSTFIVVFQNGSWKIAAIRNMLPAPAR